MKALDCQGGEKINILTQIAVTLGAWLILMLVCTNLIGFLVRGFFTNPEMDRMMAEGHDVVKKLVQNSQRTQYKINIFALVLIVVFLIALYYFLNIWFVIAALMLMAKRIPDLIWEIRHGVKVNRFEARLQPWPYKLLGAIGWATVPVLWYAIYRM